MPYGKRRGYTRRAVRKSASKRKYNRSVGRKKFGLARGKKAGLWSASKISSALLRNKSMMSNIIQARKLLSAKPFLK